ncbi:coiledcoil domain containing, partial [Perkinsus olseni]
MGDTQSSPSPPPATTQGSNEGSVSESAMLPYLGVIEKTANEILQLFASSQVAVSGEENGAADFEVGDKYLMPKTAVAPTTSSSPVGGGVPGQSSGAQSFMTIKLPSTVEDYSDDSDEDEEDDQSLNLSL